MDSRGWSCVIVFSILGIVSQRAWTAQEIDLAKLPPASTNQVYFTRDIQPILERSCLRCHGPERAKSRFRLDNRESALNGGDENKNDIVPGNSAQSKLIHYVAGLVPEMVMPPKGKGDALTATEVGLLRAWIDQGVPWEAASALGPEIDLVPRIGATIVRGDSQKFREHFWMRENWSPGVERFGISDLIGKDAKLTLEGRALLDDYKVSLSLEKKDLGFARFGWERYRKYYDDTGGYFPDFSPSAFSLDRDLHVDHGKAWADFGLTLPNWPRVTVGYEYQYRRGNESTLQWGMVTQTLGQARSIYPATKAIDEKVHIVKLDLEHDIQGFEIEDSFRGEFYDLKTERVNTRAFEVGNSAPSYQDDIHEGYKYFQGANALRVEKQFTDWFLGSAGYLFSRLNADASFRLDPLFPLGSPVTAEKWQAQGIVLEEQTHAFNFSALFEPWGKLSVSAGLLNEWSRQEGTGNGNQDSLDSSGIIVPFPMTLNSSQDKTMLEESLGLRYAAIPFTTIFADGRLQQEWAKVFEEQIDTPNNFQRNTEVTSNLRDFRVGFDSAPWSRVSLGGHYRRSEKEIDYDHIRDVSDKPTPGDGYPAFIRNRRADADEIESRLMVRPLSWLKTTFSHKYVVTSYETTTDPLFFGSPDPLILAGTAPRARYRANVYSLNAALSPWQRWYWSGTFSWQPTEIAAFANGSPSVVPYRGDLFNVIASGTYILTRNTDFQITYAFSWADYSQDNFADGLPLGVKYTRHGVTAGLTHRLAKALSTKLQYGFYRYGEPTSGGFNNYTAHAVFATLVLHLQ